MTPGCSGQAGALWTCHCVEHKALMRRDTCLLVPVPKQPSKGKQKGGPPEDSPTAHLPLDSNV